MEGVGYLSQIQAYVLDNVLSSISLTVRSLWSKAERMCLTVTVTFTYYDNISPGVSGFDTFPIPVNVTLPFSLVLTPLCNNKTCYTLGKMSVNASTLKNQVYHNCFCVPSFLPRAFPKRVKFKVFSRLGVQ